MKFIYGGVFVGGVALTAVLFVGVGGKKRSPSDSPQKAPTSKRGPNLTDAETRGKEIYVKGIGPAGRDIMASLNGVEVRAAVLTCASCHGADGSGRAEGGVTPSPIQWETLTKPYGVREPNGRKHPPYTDALLTRAITMGLDPAGNRLDGAMPRYQFTQEEMADLSSYIKRLGSEPDPGVDATAIHIGTILPPAAGEAETVRGILNAYFAKVNADGGIYQRRIEMHFAESPAKPAEQLAQAKAFFGGDQIFAFTASFVAGNHDLLESFEEQCVPVVGTLTYAPRVMPPGRRCVFRLHAGADDQELALAGFIAAQPGNAMRKTGIVFGSEQSLRQSADALALECKRLGVRVIRSAELSTEKTAAASLAKECKAGGIEALFFLGSPDGLVQLLGESAECGWKPMVLVSGPALGPELFELPTSVTATVLVALPNLPPDEASEGMKELRALTGPASGQRVALQISALASAKVLVEGLRGAGRDLRREKLIQSLEGMSKFQTGLTPPISFAPGRRVGARGAYVVEVDRTAKTIVPVSDWIESNRFGKDR